MAKKSPFPGMDPYLERHWGDIHHSLVQYARDQLQEQLPDPLRARVEERVFLESESGWTRNVFPDVRIIERPAEFGGGGEQAESGGIAVAEPIVLRIENDPMIEGFIEIRDAESGNRVITVIEFLSPANKAGGNGTEEYRRKQREVMSGDASLVEIDLLRRGQRVTAVPLERLPESHRTTYHVCVHRVWRPKEVEVYRVPLTERLPTIQIPLRPTDRDAALDLQALIDQAYRMGRYDDTDYGRELDPPLGANDAKFTAELLRAQSPR